MWEGEGGGGMTDGDNKGEKKGAKQRRLEQEEEKEEHPVHMFACSPIDPQVLLQ